MQKAKKYYLAMVFLLIFHSCAFANQNSKSKILKDSSFAENKTRIDLRKIISIESAGNPKAYNHNSQAKGLCQITPICLQEYNTFHSVKYSGQDLFNAEINKKIATWYLEVRIPQMLKHFNIAVTTENIIICYNAGISYIVKHKRIPEETKRYIAKYERR